MLSCILLLLSLATTTLTQGSFYCGSGTSNPAVFKCKQGTDCVNKSKVCDGTKDCGDGSDENLCTGYQAKSGTCDLPPYPEHGMYEVLNIPKDRLTGPGQSFQSFLLRLKCNPGYGVVAPGSEVDGYGTREIFCINGKWSQIMPECVRFCRLIPDPSVHYYCSGMVCKDYVAPGTIVNPICNSPVYSSNEGLLYMTCNDGFWDDVARCRPDCGRVTPLGVELIIDGKPAKRGELPWHVGIYRKPKPYSQICGGTLVSNDVVISAAHCFWSDHKKLESPSNYAVAVGKLYREWDDKRDIDAQKSHVKKITIPALFQGVQANFQEDIAAVILTTSVTYKTYVRPICLNYDDIFDRLQLQQGNLGKVAGWGLTTVNGVSSSYLQVVDLPFINEATCIRALPPSFRPYITGDKFCAGYTNGTAVCKGDSGGGLVFSEKEQGMDRYYLRGIVSTAPTVNDQICNDKSYTTFTKITKHQEFIKNALVEAVSIKSCRKGQEATCNENPKFVEDESDIDTGVSEVPLAAAVPDDPKRFQCILPSSPGSWHYDIRNHEKGRLFVLIIKCASGYSFKNPDGTLDNSASKQISCFFGNWSQDIPECVPS